MTKATKTVTKTVVVTGALGGIGAALVRAFAGAGYRVVSCDRRSPEKPSADFVEFDIARLVAEDNYRAATVRKLRAAIGTSGLKALVNNAAVQHLGRVGEVSAKALRDTFDTNVLGPFLMIQELLPDLEKATGSVVNISSVHATLTKPGFPAYASSKAALVGMTRAMAVDLGPRIRVNCVAPAATDTAMMRAGFEGNPEGLSALAAMHPSGRIATPAEIAAVVVFLASDAASAITGATMATDGGIAGRLHDPV
jgi:NAD(P)-dependent dehydrogenase (short-subunit alcohol dehydrogenase family)